MGDNTGIQWTDATWNPTVGCSIVSPGCTNCYAMKMAARLDSIDAAAFVSGGRRPRLPRYAGTTKFVNKNAVWTGKVAMAPDHILTLPLRWKRPRRIFVNSMSDLFHESIPNEWIDRVFAVMALAPQHTFQVLTKRSKRMLEYVGYRTTLNGIEAFMASSDFDDRLSEVEFPLPNVHLGVSAEDQTRYDERKEDLRATPASVRFFSFEPLLGDIVGGWFGDWAIVGGESGKGARPMHPDWARSIRDQCKATAVPFFFKQWGEWAPTGTFVTSANGMAVNRLVYPDSDWALKNAGLACNKIEGEIASGETVRRVGKKAAGRRLDGVEHSEFPR